MKEVLVDLTSLHSGVVDEIPITMTLTYDSEYIKNTEILSLENVNVLGKITVDSTGSDYIDVKVEGEMILADSISLEEVIYPFSFIYAENIEENNKKDENTLDIMELLWENIVLEIPLKFTKVEDLSKFHGDGWKLVSEDDKVLEDNPFRELLNEFKEE